MRRSEAHGNLVEEAKKLPEKIRTPSTLVPSVRSISFIGSCSNRGAYFFLRQTVLRDARVSMAELKLKFNKFKAASRSDSMVSKIVYIEEPNPL